MPMNATSISRQLRLLGFNPVAASDRNRQGLRVTNSGERVRVSADLDIERHAWQLSASARVALADAGLTIEPCDGASFYVVAD